MSEGWSYGLSDFLMFSPDTYWRLVARYNAAWWPAQLAALAVGCGLLVALRRGGAAAARAALVVLALAWAWVGWAFHARQYAQIFLAAPWLAWACGAQALLLLAAALMVPDAQGHPAAAAAKAGKLLIALALLYPLLAPLAGRGWAQAEVFGFMPDPTALATLGALLALVQPRGVVRAVLAILPVLVLLLGAATRRLVA